MSQELVVRPLYGLASASTELVTSLDRARTDWAALLAVILLTALCTAVGAITLLGKLWRNAEHLSVVLWKGLRWPKILTFLCHPWRTTRDFCRRNEPATQREWFWRGYAEAILVERYATLRDQAIAGQWSSWARLGNVLRFHRWDGFYRRRLEVAAKAKAKAKAKPQAGPAARGGVPAY
jgi:hypothetical protein